MKSLLLDKCFGYDGTQLRSLYAYLEHGVQGDSIIAWQGPCEISFEHMVDGEDLVAQSPIRGGHMLHFIVEKFTTPLFAAVALQRILASLAFDVVQEQLRRSHTAGVGSSTLAGGHWRRDGDDIYCDERKMSISIATVSPVSALIHFAVNVSNEGTPVATCALGDFGIDAGEFAYELMARFILEVGSMEVATTKVKWVR